MFEQFVLHVLAKLRRMSLKFALRDFVAGQFFSIADMAIWPWATLWKRQDQDIDQFPNIKKWLERCENRPGVQNGRKLLQNNGIT